MGGYTNETQQARNYQIAGFTKKLWSIEDIVGLLD